MTWRSNRERRAKTPSAKLILAYWIQKGLPPIREYDFTSLEEGVCFACGIFYNLQRAHIVPLCFGGSNTVENIHLLCQRCHSWSEGNNKYWNWLAYMRKHEWKSRTEWAMKILEMNGVDMEEEAEKTKDMNWEDRFAYIRNLMSDNGICLK